MGGDRTLRGQTSPPAHWSGNSVKFRPEVVDVLAVGPTTAEATDATRRSVMSGAALSPRGVLARFERGDLQASLAIVLAASAVIHLAVTPAHLKEYTAFGVFFVAAAVLQLGAAAMCARRASRTVVWLSAALSGAIAAVWLVSRTSGLPIGPEAGVAEAVGLADVVSTIYELAAVVVAVPLAFRLARGEQARLRLSAAASTWAVFAGWITVGAIFVGH
jgi:hypothetical protein